MKLPSDLLTVKHEITRKSSLLPEFDLQMENIIWIIYIKFCAAGLMFGFVEFESRLQGLTIFFLIFLLVMLMLHFIAKISFLTCLEVP